MSGRLVISMPWGDGLARRYVALNPGSGLAGDGHTWRASSNACSMIPAFDEGGLLHPTELGQGYTCTIEEVRRIFVTELGSPEWRVRLFDRWVELRELVGQIVPSVTWWLWGCFVSNHKEPLDGEREYISALALVPVSELPSEAQGVVLLQWLQAAQATHHVDVATVFQFDAGHPDAAETLDALEYKWRPRARLGVADHATREKVPAGFLEVVA